MAVSLGGLLAVSLLVGRQSKEAGKGGGGVASMDAVSADGRAKDEVRGAYKTAYAALAAGAGPSREHESGPKEEAAAPPEPDAPNDAEGSGDEQDDDDSFM